jgi:RHS repeat-associated protein
MANRRERIHPPLPSRTGNTHYAAGRTTAITTAAGTTSLAYDYESRVTQITYPNQSTNTFTYNGLDTRVGKVDSGGTKTFKRDGVGVTAPVLSDGVSSFTPGISTRTSGASKFLHDDRLGTLGLETDANQATTATKAYDAFGMPISSTGSSASPFGFAGGYGYQEDPDSGLKLLGHRYYDSSTGRFLTRDRLKDGRNWYTYCYNNPQKWVDPKGLKGSYGSEEEAAIAACAEANQKPGNNEWCGWIYENDDGTFGYTDPEELTENGGPPSPPPAGIGPIVGGYHSHGAALPGYNNEQMSEEKGMRLADVLHIRVYLVTPSGLIWVYDPALSFFTFKWLLLIGKTKPHKPPVKPKPKPKPQVIGGGARKLGGAGRSGALGSK